MASKFDIISLGEILLRLSPPGMDRLSQGYSFEKHIGGSELNVVCGIAQMGLRASILSKLPDNAVGHYAKNRLGYFGVSPDYIIYDTSPSARLGLYYYEKGSYPRKPSVCYDRENSSVTTLTLQEVPKGIYSNARCFHVSGISLALCKPLRTVIVQIMKKFKEAGAAISFDVNYRATLWSEEEAKECVEAVLPLVDILFVSEETSRRAMGRKGTLEEIMKGYASEYGIKAVATTMRQVLSPTRHTFSSILYQAEQDKFYTEPAYENIEVVDRIGSGDAYLVGVLTALLSGRSPEEAVSYGNAVSALKSTIPGDMLLCSLEEVQQIIKTHKSGIVGSEMNR